MIPFFTSEVLGIISQRDGLQLQLSWVQSEIFVKGVPQHELPHTAGAFEDDFLLTALVAFLCLHNYFCGDKE